MYLNFLQVVSMSFLRRYDDEFTINEIKYVWDSIDV